MCRVEVEQLWVETEVHILPFYVPVEELPQRGVDDLDICKITASQKEAYIFLFVPRLPSPFCFAFKVSLFFARGDFEPHVGLGRVLGGGAETSVSSVYCTCVHMHELKWAFYMQANGGHREFSGFAATLPGRFPKACAARNAEPAIMSVSLIHHLLF